MAGGRWPVTLQVLTLVALGILAPIKGAQPPISLLALTLQSKTLAFSCQCLVAFVSVYCSWCAAVFRVSEMTKQSKAVGDEGGEASHTNDLGCSTVTEQKLCTLVEDGKVASLDVVHVPGSETVSEP